LRIGFAAVAHSGVGKFLGDAEKSVKDLIINFGIV
jgi:hypothetical protein